MLSRANTPFSQNVVAARSSAAETTAACRKCPCWQLRAPCWHRSDPQTTAERFKKLNMFNFCRRLLRWILHRVDTMVLPQTPCLYRVCTADYRGVVRLHFCHQFLVLPVQKVFSTTTAWPKTSWPGVFLSQHLLCFLYFLPPIRPAPE